MEDLWPYLIPVAAILAMIFGSSRKGKRDATIISGQELNALQEGRRLSVERERRRIILVDALINQRQREKENAAPAENPNDAVARLSGEFGSGG